jgi:hypothetical protein
MSPVEILRNCIAEKANELAQLEAALAILDPSLRGAGRSLSMPAERSAPPSAPLQSEIPERTAEPAPLPIPEPVRAVKPRGPVCGACGAGMYPTYRTMPSGATVQLLKCNDSACGNETYQ